MRLIRGSIIIFSYLLMEWWQPLLKNSNSLLSLYLNFHLHLPEGISKPVRSQQHRRFALYVNKQTFSRLEGVLQAAIGHHIILQKNIHTRKQQINLTLHISSSFALPLSKNELYWKVPKKPCPQNIYHKKAFIWGKGNKILTQLWKFYSVARFPSHRYGSNGLSSTFECI